ncbi:hypothetical protein [Planococcus versutus]|uniref:hypothetical protein n=1 Tax=Planococcus versutus TaxID=1302659 RepID=UPI0012FFB993|nr:hypothetical protein [Planococcus versutus]
MPKQKKVEVLRFGIDNITPQEARKHLEEMIKTIEVYGFEKIDIKLSVKTLKNVEPII